MGYSAEGTLTASITTAVETQLALTLHQLEEARLGPFDRPTAAKPILASIFEILGFDLEHVTRTETGSTYQFYLSGKWWFRNVEVFEYLAHNNVVFEGNFTGEDGETWQSLSRGDGKFIEESLKRVPVSLLDEIANINNTLDEALSFLNADNNSWSKELEGTEEGKQLAEVLLSLREKTRAISF